ncbi:MAG: glycosyltransferase family A protein [Bacteroidota bacterium]
MKLAEIPRSFFQSVKLLAQSPERLQKKANGTLPIIVTLTTIPSRIGTLPITIRSLLAQDRAPEKIVLWLNEEFRDKLPRALAKLQGNVFEIRFSPYQFSHRKLMHSLTMFPDKILVTCDDDLIYHPSALRLTYEQHLKHPDVVIGNRCREISYDGEGRVLPYLKWPFVTKALKNERLLMPVGAFLVLYPPNILSEMATDVALFTKISPKSDDLWFKTCTLLNNKLSISSDSPPPEPIPIFGTQRVALKHTNNTKDHKRKQWEDIAAYFKFTFD